MKYLQITDKSNGGKDLVELLEGLGFSDAKNSEAKKASSKKDDTSLQPDLVVYENASPTENDLEKIRKTYPKSMFIVLSKKKELAWKAYELGFDDFIVSPSSKERLLNCLLRLKDIFLLRMGRLESSDEQFFFIREKEGLKKLKINDITFIQALGDYINIHTSTKKVTVHLNLKHVQQRLPERKFLRIHRSFIVNMNKIEKVTGNEVYLNAHHVPVGEAHRKELNARLNIIK